MFRREKDYIDELIAQGEGLQLDFKYNISDSRKIARCMSAFANTSGGVLLIGVKDNGVIVGIRSDEELYMIEAAAEMYLKPRLNYEPEIFEKDKKTVLLVRIHEESRKPVFALSEQNKWLAYYRWNDQNILASSILLKYWKKKNMPRGTFIRYSEKEKLLLEYLKENQLITIVEIKKLLNIPFHLTEKIIVNLLSIGYLKFEVHDGTFYYRSDFSAEKITHQDK